VLTALLLAVQAQAVPLLEVRVGDAWHPWRVAAPGAAVQREPMLGAAVTWRDSGEGLRAGDFEVRAASGLRNSIAIVELDPARVRFSLGLTSPGARRAVADRLAEDSALVLAANTGLFRADGMTLGLVLVDGARHTAPARWLDAVVVLEHGALRFTDVAGAAALPPGASAFQTLPWLVRDGRLVYGWTNGLRLSRDHRDRRITLCAGDDGRIRLLLSNFEVFGATAGRVPIGLTLPEQAALAAGAGCRDAVALDGGISAQIAFRAAGRVVRWPGWRRVPLLLLVHRR
jgi:exopolysaccharide biosynthesis protein